MTTQALSAFLDELEQSAHAASVAEENYRREAAARIRELENERAFGFRRLTLMRTVADAIRDCETEDDAVVKGSAAFLREVGWSTESETQQEALEQFQPVIRACWRAAQAEAAETRMPARARGDHPEAARVRGVVRGEPKRAIPQHHGAGNRGVAACRNLLAARSSTTFCSTTGWCANIAAPRASLR